MTREPKSFIDYWDNVDLELMRLFGIDTFAAQIGAGIISAARDAGWTPEDLALWYGRDNGLTPLPGRRLS